MSILGNLGRVAVQHLGKRAVITLQRKAAGAYVDGKWVAGVSSPSTLDAVVYPSTPRDLAKLPEGERVDEAITILSEFMFRTSSVAGQLEADRVTWNGVRYRVVTVGDWVDQGGFTAVVAVRCEA